MGLRVQVDVLVPTGTGVLDLGHYVARRRMSSQEPSARPFLTQNLSLDQLQNEEAHLASCSLKAASNSLIRARNGSSARSTAAHALQGGHAHN